MSPIVTFMTPGAEVILVFDSLMSSHWKSTVQESQVKKEKFSKGVETKSNLNFASWNCLWLQQNGWQTKNKPMLNKWGDIISCQNFLDL